MLYAVAEAEDKDFSNEEIRDRVHEDGLFEDTHLLEDKAINKYRQIFSEKLEEKERDLLTHGTRLAPVDGVHHIFLGDYEGDQIQDKRTRTGS